MAIFKKKWKSLYFIVQMLGRIMIEIDDIKILDNYLSELSNNDLAKILKYKKKVSKLVIENYRYGSSWLDIIILKINLKKMNKILSKYGIIIY